MKIIEIIESKDPRRLTFVHKYLPLRHDVDQASNAMHFIRGVIEDSLRAEDLTDEEFDILEYIRLSLSENLDSAIDKANYYAREVNKMLSEDQS